MSNETYRIKRFYYPGYMQKRPRLTGIKGLTLEQAQDKERGSLFRWIREGMRNENKYRWTVASWSLHHANGG